MLTTVIKIQKAIQAAKKKIDWKAWNRTKLLRLYGSSTRNRIPVMTVKRYASAAAILSDMPPACDAGRE
jgi:hypothetical protein